MNGNFQRSLLTMASIATSNTPGADSSPNLPTSTPIISTKQLAIEKGLFRVRRPRSGSSQLRQMRGQQFQYLLALDFESTCWEEKEGRSPEIIEFPVVLCSTSDGYEISLNDDPDSSVMKENNVDCVLVNSSGPEVVSSADSDRSRVNSLAQSFISETDNLRAPASIAIDSCSAPPPPPPFRILEKFHHYVVPFENPILSSFCVSLTGITQNLLDTEGVPLHICLKRFQKWLNAMKVKYGLRFTGEKEKDSSTEEKVCESISTVATASTFLTWTSWDLGCLLPNECKRKNLRRARLLDCNL